MLTTSSQSVSDYFKAKLSAKAHGKRQARPTLAAVGATTAPSPASARDDGNDDERAGLGFGMRPTASATTTGPFGWGASAAGNWRFVVVVVVVVVAPPAETPGSKYVTVQ
jgi:hypothetical protein